MLSVYRLQVVDILRHSFDTDNIPCGLAIDTNYLCEQLISDCNWLLVIGVCVIGCISAIGCNQLFVVDKRLVVDSDRWLCPTAPPSGQLLHRPALTSNSELLTSNSELLTLPHRLYWLSPLLVHCLYWLIALASRYFLSVHWKGSRNVMG